MPTTIMNVLQAEIHYHSWATEQMWQAVLALPDVELHRSRGTSFDSIAKLLQHMYSADAVWLSRLQKSDGVQLSNIEILSDVKSLKEKWDSVLSALARFVEFTSMDEASAALPYVNSTGAAFDTPVWQVVLHLANHGTGHRGQVNGMIRQAGGQPRNTDLIHFFRAHPELS